MLKISLKFNVLLGVYIIIPLALLFIFIDQVFFKGYAQQTLPLNPEETVWYVVLFALPHIVASELTFLRKDYIQQYNRFALIMLIIALLSSIALNNFFNEQIAFAIIAIWTMIHVIGQQVGLSRINLKTSTWSFSCWKWTLIASSCFTMLILGSAQGLSNLPNSVKYFALFVFVISNFFFYFVVSKPHNRIGFWYCFSTHMMVVFSVLCFATGYSFFAILIPRVIHDVTAFIFYTTHEYNYSYTHSKSKKLNKYLLVKFISVPLTAIFLAYVFNNYFPSVFILTLILLHYLLESRIWRKNSPHRSYIIFK